VRLENPKQNNSKSSYCVRAKRIRKTRKAQIWGKDNIKWWN